MEPAEYWILDCAAQLYIPISFVGSANVEEIFNRAGHGLSNVELLELMNQLFRTGDLIALNRNKDDLEQFVPTSEEIRDALSGNLKLTYGLTLQGAKRWEEVSAPDWSRYFDGYCSDEEGEVASPNRKLAEESLVVEGMGMGVHIDPRSMIWDRPAPWEATYWKILPSAHRARFRCTQPKDDSTFLNSGMDFLSSKMYREWLNRSRWYTRPF